MTRAYIHQLATAVPRYAIPQSYARDSLKERLGDNRLAQRLVHRLYSQSGIETRYSAVGDFAPAGSESTGLFLDEQGAYTSPSTKVRNDLYTEAARPLFREAAERVLQDSPGFTAEDVTHVVTVSCTGFFAPGPDYFLVRDLGLRPNVQRFHLGFMGCYAAFPALRMAKAFCEAEPDAVVLVVCLELCTLHLQLGGDPNRLLASSIFADGAGAALVSARHPQDALYELSGLATALTPVGIGEADMAWTVGDEGFDIVLSSYVPEILGANIGAALAPLFEQYGLAQADIDHWGIHPGGRAILDKVETSLELEENALEPSRRVLRDYGNMSSATILFVLKEMLSEAAAGDKVCAVAFGPGLTVESGLLTRC